MVTDGGVTTTSGIHAALFTADVMWPSGSRPTQWPMPGSRSSSTVGREDYPALTTINVRRQAIGVSRHSKAAFHSKQDAECDA